jgi:hypothetical protein
VTGFVFFDIEDATIVIGRDRVHRVAKRVNSSVWCCLDVERSGSPGNVSIEIGKLSKESAALAEQMRNDIVGPDFPVWVYLDNKEAWAEVRWRFKNGEWNRMVTPP